MYAVTTNGEKYTGILYANIPSFDAACNLAKRIRAEYPSVVVREGRLASAEGPWLYPVESICWAPGDDG